MIKKSIKFVATNYRRVAVMLSMIVGIFCVHNSTYGAITPYLYCNCIGSYPSDNLSAGSGAPFLFSAPRKLNSFSAMTNRNESSSNGHITSKNRPAHVTGIQVFSFEGAHQVRVVEIDNNPWFVAQDVCIVLSLCNASKTVKSLDDDEKGITSSYTLGGSQQHLIVNESGLYALILRCRDAMTKGTVPYKFRKWVTSEVLPAIRKTGSYSIQNSYPGNMLPTNCAVLTCHTADGQKKQVYLMYGDETWFGHPKFNGDRHVAMQHMTHEIAHFDKETVSFETHVFHLKDGKYVKCPYIFQPHDKRPKKENAVVDCQKAIERYRKAAEDVKASAGNMIEYFDTTILNIN